MNTQKRIIARAYVEDCLGAEDLCDQYNLASQDSVKRFSQQVYGYGYEIRRKVNLRKLLETQYVYRFWPFTEG